MRIPAGVTLVRGGDGVGKTTLLRLLAGELPAQAGHLQIKGISLRDQSDLYQQQVVWINPRTTAFEQITPLHYFDTLRLRYARFPAPDAPKLADLITGLALELHLDQPIYMLSTGSKRKVWLAGAFVAGAAVTLLDDPFVALDKPSINCVLQQLMLAASHPTCACVVAHYETLGAVPLAQVIDLGD